MIAARTDGRRHGPARFVPDHLAVWLTGVVAGQEPLVEDASLDEAFDAAEWFRSVRAGYPAAVLCATYRGTAAARDGHGGDERWVELTRQAAATDVSAEDRAFTGDTTPTSLRSLRRWTSRQLEDRADLVDDAVLVVSELATNVERHSRSWLTVDVVAVDDHVLVAVTDPDVDSVPRPREVAPDQPSGRGLLVVSSVSSWWGVVVRQRTKTVWAALDGADGPSGGRDRTSERSSDVR